MAEKDTGQERTEAPTERQKTKAHDDGKVAKSQELTGAAILLAGSAGLSAAGGANIGKEVNLLMHRSADWLLIGRLDVVGASGILLSALETLVLAVSPFLIGVFLIALLVGGVQARGVVSMKPISPKLENLSPLKGFGKIFSQQSVFNLLKSIMKLVFLGGVSWYAMSEAWGDIVSLNGISVPDFLEILRRLSFRLAASTGLAFLIVAAMDFAFQLFQHKKSLKMTKEDVVREHKETEGDPLIKSRIRALARSLSRNRMLQAVPDADVVVTNPTHIAVALKYDEGASGAPVVLAMGERKIAEKIKAIAFKADVPIVENKPLARALLTMGSVGLPIPASLYLAVAEILAFVYRRRETSVKRPGRLPQGITA